MRTKILIVFLVLTMMLLLAAGCVDDMTPEEAAEATAQAEFAATGMVIFEEATAAPEPAPWW